MKFPVIRESYFLNIVILIVSLIIAGFFLFFGIAHVIEAIFGGNRYAKVTDLDHIIILVGFCVIGVVFLLIAIASAKGIQEKIDKKQS